MGGAHDTETYILIANTSPFAGRAVVTLVFDDGGPSVTRTYELPLDSRNNVAVGPDFGVSVQDSGSAP